MQLLLVLSALVAITGGQVCQNYGVANGSDCSCLPGFGGATCSQPACGGDIFQGSNRQLVSVSSSSPFGNLTSAGCTCESGWTGTGCNVCQSANACQTGYNSSGHISTSTSDGPTGSADGQNNTLTCNTSPQVWAAGEMSCQVVNPTLQAIYPGSSSLNILRTLKSSLTPVPNTTAFGSDGTAFAQLFYDGVEQFYCQASSCSQTTSEGGGADWSCQNLECNCIANTTLCGGVPVSNLTATINGLTGTLDVSCDAPNSQDGTTSCEFKQSVLQTLFGSGGLSLSGCTFGECVSQSVIDEASGNSTNTNSSGTDRKSLSGGVVAGLAVVGGLIALAILLLMLGWYNQKRARRSGLEKMGTGFGKTGGVDVNWSDVSYVVPTSTKKFWTPWMSKCVRNVGDGGIGYSDDKTVLDTLSGRVESGKIMAILGPSGAGKTTLVEILAGKSKSGNTTGLVAFTPSDRPRIGFVPQVDVLPSALTVYECLLFAARLRLPESVTDAEKQAKVEEVLQRLGIDRLKDVRIGDGERRGISGGEMRRVSIGLELVAMPDVLILDEPTSGLDSVSAMKVVNVLHEVAHDPHNPTAVIASIHQPSSQIYHSFDQILLLSHGRALYSGPGSFAPVDYLTSNGEAPAYPRGYNVADYLLEVASDPPVVLFKSGHKDEKAETNEKNIDAEADDAGKSTTSSPSRSRYAATFLTQLEVLLGRELKVLKRDKALFITHIVIAAILGVFVGGLYYQTNTTISGFQSRVGCLFFLGALVAFSSLSALYNVVQSRPLFQRERSNSYYSPAAWLLSRFIFDVVPLRIIPTIIVSSVTYWMAGLAADAAHFFKFLFILALYSLAMTLWNFLLGTYLRNGGIAILFSALSALYQMTYAGFFVHLSDIPPVLRWLQWLCPLKYTLEALSVNEVGSGLMIQDTLQGVPVDVSASLIMQLLFGFGLNNYYRDVLVLFAFIAGFGVAVVGSVWLRMRERR